MATPLGRGAGPAAGAMACLTGLAAVKLNGFFRAPRGLGQIERDLTLDVGSAPFSA